MERGEKISNYNCWGYAVGEKAWFTSSNRKYGKVLKRTYDIALGFIEEHFLPEFGKDYIVVKEEDIKPKTNLIAFKCGRYDFHFMKRFKNGHWKHKPGSCEIEKIKKEEVFQDIWRGGYYDSPTVFIALKEEYPEYILQ